MKKLIHALTFSSLALLFFSITSCEKDEGILPAISFKTGAGYTSANANIARSTIFKVGIDAAKTEKKDVLKTFNISRQYDGGASTTVYDATLSGSQGDNYSYDYNGTTRNVAGTEKYTFTVTNRDGLVNSITLTITTP